MHELSNYIVAQVSQVMDTPCWVWNGTISNKGYGRKTIRGNCRSTHTWMYEDKYGPVPEGLVLDHKCRVRICCNPEHLEAITNEENVRRGLAGHNPPHREHCRKGHLRTAENAYWVTKNGKQYRLCKDCHRERWQRKKADPEFIAFRNSPEYKKSQRDRMRKKRADSKAALDTSPIPAEK